MKFTNKKMRLLALFTLLLFTLTACVSYDKAGNPTGWVYDYFGHPTVLIMDWFANLFGGNYGVAIIIITLITRILMLPSMVNMTKTSIESAARMKIAKPEMDEIREDLQATEDPKEKMALNQELMAIQKKYGIKMLGGVSGCLPLLIQMPIISAVYAAIRSSQQIKESVFLGLNLGQTSLVLTAIVAAVYALQGWLTSKGAPTPDNPQAAQTSKSMMLMNPLLIGWITFVSSAGLGIYFLTGGFFGLGQQLYMNKFVRPKIEAKVEKDLEGLVGMAKQPRKRMVRNQDTNRLIPTKIETKASKPRRNEGKQNVKVKGK